MLESWKFVKIWMANITCQGTLKRSSGSGILGLRSGLHLSNISTCLILMPFWLQDRTSFPGIKTPWTSCCFILLLDDSCLYIQHREWMMPSKLSTIHLCQWRSTYTTETYYMIGRLWKLFLLQPIGLWFVKELETVWNYLINVDFFSKMCDWFPNSPRRR